MLPAMNYTIGLCIFFSGVLISDFIIIFSSTDQIQLLNYITVLSRGFVLNWYVVNFQILSGFTISDFVYSVQCFVIIVIEMLFSLH